MWQVIYRRRDMDFSYETDELAQFIMYCQEYIRYQYGDTCVWYIDGKRYKKYGDLENFLYEVERLAKSRLKPLDEFEM